MKCKICGQVSRAIFESTLLKKHPVKYFYCDYCKFLQTEDPHWLTEAYVHPINLTDTGILSRNLLLSNVLTVILYNLFNPSAKFLDYSGGYGIFVRLMRDIGFDFYWKDPYTNNLFARGFEHKESISIDAITCFEAFEHFVNPLEEIEKILSISQNIIFSTELLPKPTPAPEAWWYYGLEHGQHISFYSRETIDHIANKYNLIYTPITNNLHLITDKQLKPALETIKTSNFNELNIAARKRLQSKTFEDMLLLRNN